MQIEKAAEKLKTWRSLISPGCRHTRLVVDSKEARDALDCAVYAIDVLSFLEFDRPDPMAPIQVDVKSGLNGTILGGLCPRCSHPVFYHGPEWGDNYCSQCGNHLSWPEHPSIAAWGDWEA